MSNFGTKATCPDWWNEVRTGEQHEKLVGAIEFYNDAWDNTPPWGKETHRKGQCEVQINSDKWPGDPNLWPGYATQQAIDDYNERKLNCMKNRAEFEKVSDSMVRHLDINDANKKMAVVNEKVKRANDIFNNEGWNNYVDRNAASKVNKVIANQTSLKIASVRGAYARK